MSYRRTQRKETAKKPFCKVCKDAGKSEKEYTSHFVRQTPHPESPIICPTILNSKCNFCNGNGHLVSRCPSKKEFERSMKSNFNPTISKYFVAENKKLLNSKNSFAVLDSDEEEDEENEDFKVPENVTVRKKMSKKWTEIYDSDTDEE
jgi:DNA-binding cell septation regulator SpoVG